MTSNKPTVKDCHYPWTWMMVTANGAIRPCCFAQGELGNLNKASAEEIWNGKVAMELRQAIKSNKIHSVCRNAPCKFVQNMTDDDPELSLLITEDISDGSLFDEIWYLDNYPDVAEAISKGFFHSGWDHYNKFGKSEKRRFRLVDRDKN
ncbi:MULTISPECIES: SPASM domain-containing protein [Methylomonas]|uniref:SPASM domain-containing protein n=1 Tax=Methylomonas TaxID=416 RepID=UPI0016815FFB|nr:SPASM domain-containing protein [Methylomonas rhizoryzae]